MRDGRGHATSACYDAYGRVTSRRDANDTEISRYQYDPLNHLTNRWSAAKGTTTYVYDPLGNLLNTIYPDRTIQFTYDELNRLTNMVDAVGATRYSYDHAGLLLTEDGPWAYDTVTSIYNNRLRASLTLQQPGAPVAWQYGYDTAHRLDTLVSPAGMFSYRYPAAGATLARGSRLPIQVDLPVGAIVNSYDGMARVTNNILRNLAQTTLNAHAYAYNEASQRTRMTSTSAGNYVDYGYDALGQLTNAAGRELSGGALRVQEQWANTYDKAGNLAQRVKNQLTETFVADANDQLTSVSSAGTLTVGGTATPAATQVSVNGQTAALYADKTFAVPNVPLSATALTAVANDGQGHSASNTIAVSLSTPTAPQYDLNGNLLTDGWRTFSYDTDNQLVGIVVTNANGTITQTGFVYDGKARRRIRTEATLQAGAWVTNQTFRYLYDGQRVIQERDANNTVLATYTRGLDLSQSLDGAGGIGGLLARTHLGNHHFYYHSDANGNVTALINQSTNLVAQYRYDPFGNLVAQTGPLAEGNLYRFSSKEFHQASGLYYYGYRFYDPNLQRWVNRDPSGSKDGPNLHAFCHNGAVNAFDTDGQLSFPGYDLAANIWLAFQEQLHALRVFTATWAKYDYNMSMSDRMGIRADVQKDCFLAYLMAAATGNANSGGEWAKSADDDHITSYQLGYQFVFGTGESTHNFTEKSVVGSEILNADFVRQGIFDTYKDALAGNTKPHPIENKLKDIPRSDYLLGLINNVGGDNPSLAYMGTIGGNVQAGAVVQQNGISFLTLTVTMQNITSAESATRMPPPIGYAGTDWRAAFIQQNPFGANAPFRTVVENFNLTVLLPIPTVRP